MSATHVDKYQPAPALDDVEERGTATEEEAAGRVVLQCAHALQIETEHARIRALVADTQELESKFRAAAELVKTGGQWIWEREADKG